MKIRLRDLNDVLGTLHCHALVCALDFKCKPIDEPYKYDCEPRCRSCLNEYANLEQVEKIIQIEKEIKGNIMDYPVTIKSNKELIESVINFLLTK